ncbi:hypothetical protein [Cylindrospermopsis raciborskii]|uniref:hypothetical protein n=1 Tax=Cylindrospermopsis raciborskii TaxID=77022 RepID=UPI001EF9F4C4|nr:hypothetical protein [Cylindrospermopsis raciborskii]
MVLPNGKDIVDVVAGKPGPKSDVNLFRETRNIFDKKQKFSGDKASWGSYQDLDLAENKLSHIGVIFWLIPNKRHL